MPTGKKSLVTKSCMSAKLVNDGSARLAPLGGASTIGPLGVSTSGQNRVNKSGWAEWGSRVGGEPSQSGSVAHLLD